MLNNLVFYVNLNLFMFFKRTLLILFVLFLYQNTYASSSPTISVTLATNKSTFNYNEPIVITVVANEQGGNLGEIDINRVNGPQKGIIKKVFPNSSTYTYVMTYQPFSPGIYQLQAVAFDKINHNISASSSIVTVNILTPVSVTLTSPTNNSVYGQGDIIVLLASAQTALSVGSITNISYYSGNNLLKSIDAGNSYVFNWSFAHVGNYNITAVATDTMGNTATSQPVNITVNPFNGANSLNSIRTGLPTNLVGFPNRTSIYSGYGTGSSLIGYENAGGLGTMIGNPVIVGSPPVALTVQPHVSPQAWIQVHFFDTNLTGWVIQTNSVTLARSTSAVAVYALTNYADKTLSMVPVGTIFTQQQVNALNNALNALSGTSFIVFGGKVLPVNPATTININNLNDIVSMNITDARGINIGTTILRDMSNVYTPLGCDSINDSWADYASCVLDKEAKLAYKTASTFAITNNDPAVAQIKTYLNQKYASIGGVNNFVITVNTTAQEVDIDPATTNSLKSYDNLHVAFNNDADAYKKQNIIDNYNQYKNSILDGSTNSFYVIGDNVIDSFTLQDFNQGSYVSASNSPSITTNVQSQSSTLSTGLSAQVSAPAAAPEDLSACYKRQGIVGETYQQPCNNIIGIVTALLNKDHFVSFLEIKHEMEKLRKIGYVFNYDYRIGSAGVLDLLLRLVLNKGQILVTHFHGLLGKPDYIGPFACIDGGNGTSDLEANKSKVLSQLHTAYPTYLKVDPLNADLTLNPNFGIAYVSEKIQEYPECDKGQYGLYIQSSMINVPIKGLQIHLSCFGNASRFHALNVLSAPTEFKNFEDYALYDVALFVAHALGFGPVVGYPDLKFVGVYPPFLIDQVAYDTSYNSMYEFSGLYQQSYVKTMNHLYYNGNGNIDFPTKTLDTRYPVPPWNNFSIKVRLPYILSDYPLLNQPENPFNSLFHLSPYVVDSYPTIYSGEGSSDYISYQFSDSFVNASKVSVKADLPYGLNHQAIISYDLPGPVNPNIIPSPINPKKLTARFYPEIGLLDDALYQSMLFVRNVTPNSIPTMTVSLEGLYSDINGVPILGNSLAYLTKNNKTTSWPFYYEDQYFRFYNDRFNDNSDAFNYKRTFHVTLGPYLNGYAWLDELQTWSGNTYIFLEFNQGSFDWNSPNKLPKIMLDASRCTTNSLTGVTYKLGGTESTTGYQFSDQTIEITIPSNNGDLGLGGLWSSQDPQKYLKITIKGGFSSNDFPVEAGPIIKATDGIIHVYPQQPGGEQELDIFCT